MTTPIPAGKVLIHSTNDPIDIGKDYDVEYPIIGDAKLVLCQLIEACKDLLAAKPHRADGTMAEEIASLRQEWLGQWEPKLTSDEIPISPDRVLQEFMNVVGPGGGHRHP